MNQQQALQAIMDGMSIKWQQERSSTQMTLGKLIAALESLPADTDVIGLCDPHSYRGYYCDLAFQPVEPTLREKMKASCLLDLCRNSMGRCYEGYKGGEFMMGESTPVWVAYYGNCGQKLIALNQDGSIELADDK